MTNIVISAGGVSVEAELNDGPTARAILDALPITAHVNLWGDEIYFEIPVHVPQCPDARVEVEVGDLGYWPMGHAFCIFFGPTPVSTGNEPRAASPVNVIGRVVGDAEQLRDVEYGTDILIAAK